LGGSNKRTGGNKAGELGGKIMKKCSITSECPFFNDQLAKMHTAKEREDMKRKYCGGGNISCARYIVAEALGLNEVPGNLFPDDFFKISVILGI
jgi:hypothetical protein